MGAQCESLRYKLLGGLAVRRACYGVPVRDYVDTAVRHVLLRQGVLGIKVKIMLPWDPNGKIGPKNPLPDNVSIVEPKEEEPITGPRSESKGTKPAAPEQQIPQQAAMPSMPQQAAAPVGMPP